MRDICVLEAADEARRSGEFRWVQVTVTDQEAGRIAAYMLEWLKVVFRK